MNIAQSMIVIKKLMKNEDCRALNMLLDRTVARVCDYLFTELFPMEEWLTCDGYMFRKALRKKFLASDYEIVSFMEHYKSHEDSYCCSLDFAREDYRNMKRSGMTNARNVDEYTTHLTVLHAELVLETLTQLLAYLEEKYQIRADQIEMRKNPQK